MSATVVQVPVSGTQIRDAERAVVGRFRALELRTNSTAVRGVPGAVGPVGVELSSGAVLRLDPPAAASPIGSPVDRSKQVTLAYLAN